MLRVVGFHLLMFMLPFLAYGVYLFFSRLDPLKRSSWEASPFYWLVVGGLVLTLASFVVVATFSGYEPGGTYVPARMEDGRVIPGRIE